MLEYEVGKCSIQKGNNAASKTLKRVFRLGRKKNAVDLSCTSLKYRRRQRKYEENVHLKNFLLIIHF